MVPEAAVRFWFQVFDGERSEALKTITRRTVPHPKLLLALICVDTHTFTNSMHGWLKGWSGSVLIGVLQSKIPQWFNREAENDLWGTAGWCDLGSHKFQREFHQDTDWFCKNCSQTIRSFGLLPQSSQVLPPSVDSVWGQRVSLWTLVAAP